MFDRSISIRCRGPALLGALLASCMVCLSAYAQPPEPKRINEIRSLFEVYDDDKDLGAIVVELHLGDVIRRWEYGAGQTWPEEFTTRFVERANIDTNGSVPSVFVQLKERPNELDIRAGLKIQVYLYVENGQALEFRGQRVFNTRFGEEPLKLLQIVPQTAAPAGAASIARSPGLPSDTIAGQAQFYSRLWPLGSTVTVAFKGGSAEVRRRVARVASEWVEGANLMLDFGADLSDRNDDSFYEWPANGKSFDIRIAFDHPVGWSAVGTDSRNSEAVSDRDASLNLSPLQLSTFPGNTDSTRAETLHVFGHALGLAHTFQHPDAEVDFRWEDDPGYVPTRNELGELSTDSKNRRPGIYSRMGGPPWFWLKGMVDERLRPHSSNWMPLTPSADSVMVDPFPSDFFRDGEDSPWWHENLLSQLSKFDRKLIRTVYPLDDENLVGERRIVEEARDALLTQESRAVNEDSRPLDSEITKGWKVLPEQPFNPELEGGNDPSLDFEEWMRNCLISSKFVCRFVAREDFVHDELGAQRTGQGFGTGILVAPSLILTCNHVVPEESVAASSDVVFKIAAMSDGVFSGGYVESRFRLSKPAIIHHSKIEDLDFSLVRVSPGSNNKLPGALLGYYQLSTSQLPRESLYPHVLRVLVIHHPGGNVRQSFDPRGQTLKLLKAKYLAYDARTDRGSSGAPVFNDLWWLVALHRGKKQSIDEHIEFYDTYAKGVRIDVIIESIINNCPPDVLSELSLREGGQP